MYNTFFTNQLFICLKGKVTSLDKVAIGNKAKIVLLVNRVFGQKFTRNAKICCFVSKFVLVYMQNL